MPKPKLCILDMASSSLNKALKSCRTSKPKTETFKSAIADVNLIEYSSLNGDYVSPI